MTPEDLKRWREERYMYQTEVATLLGVAASTWSRWERGVIRIECPTMLELALERLAQDYPKVREVKAS